jgi:ATP/maltotriose-dependent transcriptional regulator MalT
LSNTFINLGINYTQLSEYDLAFPYINRGLKIAREINSPENIILGFEALSDYYQKIASFDLALESYKNAITLRDSINAKEVKQNIASLEAVYENELKDKEIKNFQYQVSLQKSENTTQWAMIIFLLLLLTSFIAFYNLRRKHNKFVIRQMRDDIQEYIQRIEKYEHKPEEEEAAEGAFYKNVEQYGLSEREVDVLLLISQGLKNDEIAEKLFISLSTVKTHTRNIFVKLDVRNRIEAARKTQIL